MLHLSNGPCKGPDSSTWLNCKGPPWQYLRTKRIPALNLDCKQLTCFAWHMLLYLLWTFDILFAMPWQWIKEPMSVKDASTQTYSAFKSPIPVRVMGGQAVLQLAAGLAGYLHKNMKSSRCSSHEAQTELPAIGSAVLHIIVLVQYFGPDL